MALSFWLTLFVVSLMGALFVRGAQLAGGRLLALQAAGTFAVLVALHTTLGLSGVLQHFDRKPPPFAIFFPVLIASTLVVSFSKVGTALVERLSFRALVGFQTFRVLAELLIYAGVHEGIAPKQLSFEGYNFDIVTALSAGVLAWSLRGEMNPQRFRLVRFWNWFGIAALTVIAFIAITSMPTPLRLFMNEPSNVWVTRFPYILLPGVLVVAAASGHALVFRKLRMPPRN